MLRFLFLLLIVYFVYKMYRAFTTARVIVKNYHYHDNRTQGSEPEGSMHIKENPAKKAGSQNSLDSAGEYIDYEEVKD